MSKLKILDLSFCETEVATNLVQGGSWSAYSDSANSSGYYAGYSIDKTTSSYSVLIYGGVNGAVAGSVAGALSDGITFASSYASAIAS